MAAAIESSTSKALESGGENAATSGAKISTAPQPSKPVHTILLDSSPILLNTPTLSSLLSQSHTLVTTESVISEIRDADARLRFENTYRPFLTIRKPQPESARLVKDFARRTGDAAILSGTDLEVLALAYDLEYERNGGDWRLRRVPGQKRVNGSRPAAQDSDFDVQKRNDDETAEKSEIQQITNDLRTMEMQTGSEESPPPSSSHEVQPVAGSEGSFPESLPAESQLSSDSDSEGWITPSNIKKYQAQDLNSVPTSKRSEQKLLQVATITGDFAMQNVLLQMNLNLLSPNTCKRITQLKQTILRCHGCFLTTKEMDKQFCPRCGKPTLTRVSCTTNEKGEVKLHLKANMQWNNRGNVFSVPKPVSGRSNQKWTGPRDGGGKGGWGRGIVLAEDQKEYTRAGSGRQRKKEKDLMDEDYLPGILTGERTKNGGRIRVGVDRNINARKR